MSDFLIGWMIFQKDRLKRVISTSFSDTQNRQPEPRVPRLYHKIRNLARTKSENSGFEFWLQQRYLWAVLLAQDLKFLCRFM
jgi:hypothetical protein